MLEWMRRGRQGIGGAALAGVLLAWLTLFCGHCLAAAGGPDPVADASRCPHAMADPTHDCCSHGGHDCTHDGQLQAVPAVAPDALIASAADPHPLPAVFAHPAQAAQAPGRIRAGPGHERPLWKRPPLYLFHRVLRD